MLDKDSSEVLKKETDYFYDANGNQLKQNSSFTSQSSIKKRQSTKGSAQGDDADGTISSLIERSSNAFDGFNRLKKVENVEDGVRTLAEYTYNGDDMRVRKSVKSSDDGYTEKVTSYLYDRQYVILETDGANAVKARYIKGVNYIAKLDASNNPSYFMYNGHGDVVQTVTATGEVQNQYDYDIWGNPTLTVETEECSIHYAGEYLDSESGLYYLRARFYDSYSGRFMSEDSYCGEDENPLSLNRYTYCHNDPIQFFDPSGHSYYSDDGGKYTWHPNGKVTEVINIASDILPLGALLKAESYYVVTGDYNTTGAQVAINTGTDAVSFITGGLLKGGKLSVNAFKVVSGVRAANEAVDWTLDNNDYMATVTNVGQGIVENKGVNLEKLTYEEVLYDVMNQAGLTTYLTDRSKETIDSRVEYIKQYISDKGEDFTIEDLQKDFEGYYNKDGYFINGYLQNVEGKEIPTKLFEDIYNTTEGWTIYEATVEHSKKVIDECWYDKFDFQSYIKDGNGFKFYMYYKNDMPVKVINSYIKDGEVYQEVTGIYENGEIVDTQTVYPLNTNDEYYNYNNNMKSWENNSISLNIKNEYTHSDCKNEYISLAWLNYETTDLYLNSGYSDEVSDFNGSWSDSEGDINSSKNIEYSWFEDSVSC